MTLEAAVDLTEGKQFLFRDNALLGKHCIKQGRSMSLGEHKPITVRIFNAFPCCVFRSDVHNFEEKQCQNIGCAERSARMPAFCG